VTVLVVLFTTCSATVGRCHVPLVVLKKCSIKLEPVETEGLNDSVSDAGSANVRSGLKSTTLPENSTVSAWLDALGTENVVSSNSPALIVCPEERAPAGIARVIVTGSDNVLLEGEKSKLAATEALTVFCTGFATTVTTSLQVCPA
jgi:hypothetical protein